MTCCPPDFLSPSRRPAESLLFLVLPAPRFVAVRCCITMGEAKELTIMLVEAVERLSGEASREKDMLAVDKWPSIREIYFIEMTSSW